MPDKGEVFIDQNAARYPRFPMEPMFRAIKELAPDFDMDKMDVAIDRNSFAKLYDSVTTSSRGFELDVQIVGKTAVCVRREKQATEFISSFRGFGYTFPEEYTSWDTVARGSTSHHRIAEFRFGGLKYLIRFECDGYLPAMGGKTDVPELGHETGSKAGIDEDNLNSSLAISVKNPQTASKLNVSRAGYKISDASTIDIKTRAAHKPLDLETVLPRLWMSQTRNLIAAYHKGGYFNDIQIKDVSSDIERWEVQHAQDLQKLSSVVEYIIRTVKESSSKKCRVMVDVGGRMQIVELGADYPSALPVDDVDEQGEDKAHVGQGGAA